MNCERCGKRERKHFIRKKEVCSTCYKFLSADNKERHRLGIKIPDNFKTIINEINFKISVKKKNKHKSSLYNKFEG